MGLVFVEHGGLRWVMLEQKWDKFLNSTVDCCLRTDLVSNTKGKRVQGRHTGAHKWNVCAKQVMSQETTHTVRWYAAKLFYRGADMFFLANSHTCANCFCQRWACLDGARKFDSKTFGNRVCLHFTTFRAHQTFLIKHEALSVWTLAHIAQVDNRRRRKIFFRGCLFTYQTRSYTCLLLLTHF